MSLFGPQTELYWSSAIIGLVAAAILAYPIFKILLLLKSRQTVSQYAPEGHQKKQGTPTMGGLIIVAGAMAGLIYAIVEAPHRIPNYDVSPLLAALVLLIGFAMVGFTDDFVVPRLMKGKRGLGWKQKILMQVVIGGLAVWLDHRSFDLVWFLGLFFVLFFSNAYNFADGLDWLAGTLLAALGVGLIVVAWYARSFDVALLVGPILGGLVPFLVLNRPPAKIFMGDVGSLPIGAVLGYCVSATAWPSLAPHLFTWGYGENMGAYSFSSPMPSGVGVIAALVVLSFMMVVELVPVPLQIASVKLRKKKLFPYTPVHHAFEKAGWREGKVVALFFATQVVLSILAWAVISVSNGMGQEATRQQAIDHIQGMRSGLDR